MAQSRSRANVARYLTVTATQGGADTFNQGSVATGIVPENGVGFRVLSIDVAFISVFITLSADSWIMWSITRDTKTAAVSLNDPDTIYFNGFSNALTTSGEVIVPQVYRSTLIDGIYIVEPTIYFQLGSASTGITNVATARIYYEEVSLSEVDILRVLNNA